MENSISLKEKIQGLKSTLPGIILEAHFRLRPDLKELYSEKQVVHYKNDIAWILSFLSEAVWAGQSVLFEEFISWLKTLLASVNVPLKDVQESILILREELNRNFTPDENELINSVLDKGIGILNISVDNVSMPANENQLSALAGLYLEKLLTADRIAAMDLIMSKVKNGIPVKEIYLEVFQPVQYEIGRLWQTNRISVAQEHYCTGVTQLVMSQLYPYLFSGQRKNKKMVASCVSGELHEIGARMVTDFFEMDGWDTYYLGANMTVDGVVRYIADLRPQLLAISATMTFHVSAVEEMIRHVRSAVTTPSGMKIMVGGYPFKVSPRLWEYVGADGFASSAEEAVHLAEKLLSS